MCIRDRFHFYKPIEALYGQLKNGVWGVTALSQPVHRLSRQTLLLMGFGYIGKITAQRAHALGMTVLAYDPVSYTHLGHIIQKAKLTVKNV